ncbi:CPBP family intramembrane glutamic endopeptidase [Corynebacterium mustelae]|nr:CPBP family intramembrane glutamic endopeptidase [Corynebacterium mustelae]
MNTSSSPRIPINSWGLTVRAVIAFVILLAANFIRTPFHVLFDVQGEAQTPTEYVIKSAIFCVTPVVVVFLVWLWLRYIERQSWAITTFHFRLKPALSGAFGGLIVVAIPVVIAWLILSLIETPAEISQLQGATENPVTTTMMIAQVVFIFVRAVILQGFPEELLYRGWLFGLTAKNRPIFTLIWTTLAFTVIHLVSSGGQQSWTERLLYLVMPLGMGLIAGAVRLWKDSGWWSMGTHGGFHVLNPLIMFINPVGVGASGWIAMGLAQAIMAGIIILLWQQKHAAA